MDYVTIRELAEHLQEHIASGDGDLKIVADENNVTEPGAEFTTIRSLFDQALEG